MLVTRYSVLTEMFTKCTFDFDEFCAVFLSLLSVSSVFSVLVFLSVSLCLSDDDDDDTKRELHKSGLATLATFLTFATLEGKRLDMIHESQKGVMRI